MEDEIARRRESDPAAVGVARDAADGHRGAGRPAGAVRRRRPSCRSRCPAPASPRPAPAPPRPHPQSRTARRAGSRRCARARARRSRSARRAMRRRPASAAVTGTPAGRRPRRRRARRRSPADRRAVGRSNVVAGAGREPGVSQVWYEEHGRRDSPRRARSHSDRRRRRTCRCTTSRRRASAGRSLVGVLAVLASSVGTIAFAMTRGGTERRSRAAAGRVANAGRDAAGARRARRAQSSTPAPARDCRSRAGSATTPAVAIRRPHRRTTVRRRHEARQRAPHPGRGHEPAPTELARRPVDDIEPGDDLAKRRAGGPTPRRPNPTTTTVIDATPKDTTQRRASAAPRARRIRTAAATTSATAGRRRGARQEGRVLREPRPAAARRRRHAGAAANFKKALELDPKNIDVDHRHGRDRAAPGPVRRRDRAPAQGRAGSRRATRSVFTLLGEAYLNSGNNATAADNFKKALQLDPDNARARDGYNEASSRVPPPTDDN